LVLDGEEDEELVPEGEDVVPDEPTVVYMKPSTTTN
jgi:hypothetical protein